MFFYTVSTLSTVGHTIYANYTILVNVHFTYFNPLSHKIVLMYVNGWKLLTFESVFIFLTM